MSLLYILLCASLSTAVFGNEEAEEEKSTIIGIDLGTTYSWLVPTYVAVFDTPRGSNPCFSLGGCILPFLSRIGHFRTLGGLCQGRNNFAPMNSILISVGFFNALKWMKKFSFRSSGIKSALIYFLNRLKT